MADITQTPADVRRGSTAVVDEAVQLAVAGNPGDVVYKVTSGVDAGKAKLAKDLSTEEANAYGILLEYVDANGYGSVVTGGPVDPGGTVAAGQVYAVSANAGKIALESDVASTKFMTILGVGNASGEIDINIFSSGTAHA
jgi:hypothetical protein